MVLVRGKKFPWKMNPRPGNSGSGFQHPPLVLVLLEVPSFPGNNGGNSKNSDFKPKSSVFHLEPQDSKENLNIGGGFGDTEGF